MRRLLCMVVGHRWKLVYQGRTYDPLKRCAKHCRYYICERCGLGGWNEKARAPYRGPQTHPLDCKKTHWGIADCQECGLKWDEQPDFPVIIPERFNEVPRS